MAATVTQRDIAEYVGMAKPTVSVVLSRKGDEFRISKDTQKLIFDAAKKLGYKPNMHATALRGGTTNSIAALLDMSSSVNALGSEMAKYFTLMANEHKQTAYIRSIHYVNPRDDLKDITRALDDLLSRSPDGLILDLATAYIDTEQVRLLEEQVLRFKGVVLITREHLPVGVDQVVHDRYEAIGQAADYLVNTGRRNPAIIYATKTAQVTMLKKVTTFRSRLQNQGVVLNDKNVFRISESELSNARSRKCYECLCERLNGSSVSFDSMFCTSDDMAMAALSFFRERHIRVPEDVAIVGFGNLDASQFSYPPLATVEHLTKTVCELADSMLRDRLKSPKAPVRSETVHMEFVARESAG